MYLKLNIDNAIRLHLSSNRTPTKYISCALKSALDFFVYPVLSALDNLPDQVDI